MKNFTLKKAATLLLAASMSLCLFGCGSSSASTDTSAASTDTAAAETTTETAATGKIAEIQKKGQLVLGTASGYPPFEFASTDDNGAIVGIDIALGQAIADKLGVELVVNDMPFSELVMNLSAGNCDIAIAGMPETEERAQVVDFSNVYVNDEQGIIVRAEDADKYTSLEDFAGKVVDVEMGASSQTVAENELTGATINPLSTISDCILELQMGKCDAVVTGLVVSKQYVMNDDSLAEVDSVQFVDKDKPTQACVAKGEEDFLALVNEVIKENQDNGNFDKWITEYSALSAKQANG